MRLSPQTSESQRAQFKDVDKWTTRTRLRLRTPPSAQHSTASFNTDKGSPAPVLTTQKGLPERALGTARASLSSYPILLALVDPEIYRFLTHLVWPAAQLWRGEIARVC
jgi:hypothetical protein